MPLTFACTKSPLINSSSIIHFILLQLTSLVQKAWEELYLCSWNFMFFRKIVTFGFVPILQPFPYTSTSVPLTKVPAVYLSNDFRTTILEEWSKDRMISNTHWNRCLHSLQMLKKILATTLRSHRWKKRRLTWFVLSSYSLAFVRFLSN